MNAATITALSAAIVAVLGAVTALLHSIGTRRQVNNLPASPPGSNTPPTRSG